MAVRDIAAKNAFGRTDGAEPISDFGVLVLILAVVEAEAVGGNTDADGDEKRSRNRSRERGPEHEFSPFFNHEAVTNYDNEQGQCFFAFIRFRFVLSQTDTGKIPALIRLTFSQTHKVFQV
jgi:hypothetical protein